MTHRTTYTAVDDDTLMVEQWLGDTKSLVRVFNFQSRQITTIYQAKTGYGKASNISTNMEISKFSYDTVKDDEYIESMRNKLDELLAPPVEESEPTLEYDSTPDLSP